MAVATALDNFSKKVIAQHLDENINVESLTKVFTNFGINPLHTYYSILHLDLVGAIDKEVL